MRLRCADGVTRRFRFSVRRKVGGLWTGEWQEARCQECGVKFGVREARVLRKMFYTHICTKETPDDDHEQLAT